MNDDQAGTAGANRGKRPRRSKDPKGVSIDDPLEYGENKCSDNVRKVGSVSEQVDVDLWFHKHYLYRHHLGDEFGKREGIDPDTVKALVVESVKHLVFCSTMLKGFRFINHDSQEITRVVCQKEIDGVLLNVAIEAHYIDINKFEITVITAKKENGFKMKEGQYSLEVTQSGIMLRKLENRKIIEILEL